MSDHQLSSLAKIWKSRIDQWKASGLVYSQSFYWKSRFLELEQSRSNPISPDAFIELKDRSASDSDIVVEINSVKMYLSNDFDQSTFMKCIELLRRKAC